MFEHDYITYPELTNSQLQEMQFSSPHQQITEDFTAEVIKVHDGDTITLRTDFRDFDFPMRFADVDTKELNAGGQEAKDWLKSKIENQEVQILIDPKNRVEKYGRLLGKVFHQGIAIGQEEINLGLAVLYGMKNEGQIPKEEALFNIKQWL
jgi:endonuclease YncB( thermonuclease family)